MNDQILAKHVLIMAGGTGGHIYPALAVADELKQRGFLIHWLGSIGGMEQELIEKEAIDLHLLPVKGIRGKGLVALLKSPFVLFNCIVKATRIITSTESQLIVGFGGFASGPGGIAAWIKRRPLIIHEQNAIAGLTNRVLSVWATLVCQAFSGAFKSSSKVKTTGNPLRKSITGCAVLEKEFKSDQRLNVLIIGGSRGARIFNDELPDILSEFVKKHQINVRHQTGKGNLRPVQMAYAQLEANDVEISEFIFDMGQAYNWADLVICRAGALTVSEIAARGLSAIFIPYPYAVDDHQTANAQSLVDHEAAIIVKQQDIGNLRKVILNVIQQPELLVAMGQRASKLAVKNATTLIADCCENIIHGKAI